jgi:hypothetical protein
MRVDLTTAEMLLIEFFRVRPDLFEVRLSNMFRTGNVDAIRSMNKIAGFLKPVSDPVPWISIKEEEGHE